MKPVSYTFQSDDAIQGETFELPDTSNPHFPSCGVFAFPKSGSVLVNAVVRDLMAAVDVPVVDWAGHWFERGADMASVQVDLNQAFPGQGYCFAGFRQIPRCFLGASAIRRLRKVIVVRDPRDMLVSRYFSTKYSHGFKPRGTPQFAQLIGQLIEDGQFDLDSYCLFYSWIVNSDFFTYREIIRDYNTKIFRYEDFIYDKNILIYGICNWFNIQLVKEKLDSIAATYEAIPEVERPNDHMRQAHPGDYLRKLKPSTITTLNSVLSEYMSMFGYGAQ